MKVKIGGQTYDSKKEPILIVFEDQDLYNICNRLPANKKYCSYPVNYDMEKVEELINDE